MSDFPPQPDLPPPAPPTFTPQPATAPGPPAPGWWLASDGRWYPPPQQSASYVMPPAPTTNGMAIASMVLGILWLYWIGSILALIFGYVAKSQIKQSYGRQGGGGMATAGIVLGWIGVGTLTLIIAIAIASASSGY